MPRDSTYFLDTEGTAIIMCSTDKEQRYRALSSGMSLIESCLHLHLTEHLNSEIGLGTITDLRSAKVWLHNSYLFQRLQKNPSHYDVGGKQQGQTWQDRLDDLVSESVASLCKVDLVREEKDPAGRSLSLAATEYGEIMSRVSFFTFLPSSSNADTTLGAVLYPLPDRKSSYLFCSEFAMDNVFLSIDGADPSAPRQGHVERSGEHSGGNVLDTVISHNSLRSSKRFVKQTSSLRDLTVTMEANFLWDTSGSTMSAYGAVISRQRNAEWSDSYPLTTISLLQVYNNLKSNIDIRMPVKKVEKGMDKVMILIQVRLPFALLLSSRF